MECSSLYTLILGLLFILGYAAITFENFLRVDKAATALLMAVILWTGFFLFGCYDHKHSIESLLEHFTSVCQIVFFLLGALVIVELISAHRGFSAISAFLNISSKRLLLWVIGLITFFLSSVLDNLTTTIVMVSLLTQLLPKGEERWIFGGAIVIAANAGGAWTAIGDVTTTMLWIGGQISAGYIMLTLFLPSFVCLIVALGILSFLIKNTEVHKISETTQKLEPYGLSVLILGILMLMFVPVFKVLTGLPPFMGIFLGVGVLWLYTDIIHDHMPHREHLKMLSIFKKVDLASLFFFTGILLSVGVLASSHILSSLAQWLSSKISHLEVIATIIGLVSAVVDNVPIVAAAMGMYDLSSYPTDSPFWQLVAYCAGTGGSILVIGSAAGVVYMGIEKVTFGWYLRRIGPAALISYFAGIFIHQAQAWLFHT